jgi:hypothetical protein
MGIGCIDLNPSDEKELDELIEDVTIWSLDYTSCDLGCDSLIFWSIYSLTQSAVFLMFKKLSTMI